MKIGIVTFHASHNYGAMLQAFALKKQVELFGHECSIINYKTDKVINDYKILKFNTKRACIQSCLNLIVYNQLKQSWDKFEDFSEKYFDLTERYKTVKEVQNAKFEFDALICGSDQVWNPRGRADAVYFLDFCNKNDVKKIAYAPSFGKGDIPEHRFKEYKESISRFNFLSAREKAGVDIIKKLTDRDAKLVSDPVFFHLKEEWENSFNGIQIEKPYILCYFLDAPSEIQKVIEFVKKFTNYNTVFLLNRFYSKVKVDCIIRNAGPEDFVSLFNNASFVITTSFHGTAFSIINRKPFLYIKNRNTDSRVIDLLERLNLSKQYIVNEAFLNSDLLNVNYSNVEDLINQFILESKEYLLHSLNENTI